MKTFSEIKLLLSYVSKTVNAYDTSYQFMIKFFNDSVRTICNIRGGDWRFLKQTTTLTGVTGQDFYLLPQEFRSIITVVDNSDTSNPVPLRPVLNDNSQDGDYRIHTNNDFKCLEIEFVDKSFVAGGIGGKSHKVYGRIKPVNLSADDYTTGTVSGTASSSFTYTDLTGSGTTFTSAMVGRYIKFANNNNWYRITDFTDATHIEIYTNKQVFTLSGSTYTIAELCILPEAYIMAPVYRAMALHQQINNPTSPSSATVWWNLYDGGYEAGQSRVYGGIIGQMLEVEGKTLDTNSIAPNREMVPDPLLDIPNNIII